MRYANAGFTKQELTMPTQPGAKPLTATLYQYESANKLYGLMKLNGKLIPLVGLQKVAGWQGQHQRIAHVFGLAA